MIRSQITKFTNILCHENLELYGTLFVRYHQAFYTVFNVYNSYNNYCAKMLSSRVLPTFADYLCLYCFLTSSQKTKRTVTASQRRLVQWNLRKQTPHVTETSTMQTNGRSPELFPIVYCTQHSYMLYLCIVETSLLRITDTEVTPQWTKSIQFSL